MIAGKSIRYGGVFELIYALRTRRTSCLSSPPTLGELIGEGMTGEAPCKTDTGVLKLTHPMTHAKDLVLDPFQVLEEERVITGRLVFRVLAGRSNDRRADLLQLDV